MCVPRGVCASATARHLAAKGLALPPWSLPPHRPAHSPDSSNTSRRSRYYYLERGKERQSWKCLHLTMTSHRWWHKNEKQMWLSEDVSLLQWSNTTQQPWGLKRDGYKWRMVRVEVAETPKSSLCGGWGCKSSKYQISQKATIDIFASKPVYLMNAHVCPTPQCEKQSLQTTVTSPEVIFRLFIKRLTFYVKTDGVPLEQRWCLLQGYWVELVICFSSFTPREFMMFSSIYLYSVDLPVYNRSIY